MDKTTPRCSGPLEAKHPSGLVWMIALVLLGMISLPLSLFYSNPYSRGEPQWVPVALHSILHADYGADPRATRIPAAKLNLIREALADQAGDGGAESFENVQEGLRTPVPTIRSGLPTATATIALPTATATLMVQKATATQPRPTSTRSHPTQTASPTATPTTVLLLPTGTPSATKVPTRTSKPAKDPEPTQTPRPTQKPTEPPPTKPPPTKPPTKPSPTDPYPPPPPPPPPKPTDPYP
jgi:hypothetical protein